MSRQINHPWQTLGVLFDSPLLLRDSAVPPNQLNYWGAIGFTQKVVHLPFFYSHRLVQQAHYYENLRGTKAHPGKVSYFSETPSHPLIDGQRLHFGRSTGGAIGDVASGRDLRSQVGNTIQCNMFRALAFKQKKLLAAGEVGTSVRTEGQKGATLVGHWGTWQGFAESLAKITPARNLNGALSAEPELCTSGLIGMLDELRALAANAKELVEK